MKKKFTCPRRIADGMADPGSMFKHAGVDLDTYQKRDGHKHCSYCGSLSGVEFLAAVEAGVEVGPTDKSYKLYMDLPRNSTAPVVLSSTNRLDDPSYTRYEDLTVAQRKAVTMTEPEQWAYSFHVPATTHEKFYTHHFSEEQGWAFWDLHIAGSVNWGYPGYPYTRLYVPGPSTQEKKP